MPGEVLAALFVVAVIWAVLSGDSSESDHDRSPPAESDSERVVDGDDFDTDTSPIDRYSPRK